MEVFMKNAKKVTTNLLHVLALVGTLSMTAACSKKDDSNPPVAIGAQPLVCQGTMCANVGQAPGVLISAGATASVNGTQIDMAMDVIGDATRFNINDPKAVITYNGPAAIAGYLRIQGSGGGGNFGSGVCGAFPGDYYMQAIQQGSMTMATVTGGRIAGTGPNGGRIEATILQGVLYNGQDPNGTSKGSSTNRLYLNMVIESVNGQPCRYSVSTN